MNKSLIVAVIALSLAACNRSPKVDTVREEVLSKDMVTPTIEVTHQGCGALSQAIGRTCKIVRIESTATAISNGGSNWNRENAYNAACLQALSNVSHWINQDVTSEREMVTVSKNNEVSASTEAQNSSDRAKNFDTSNRENSNDMNREVRNTVRINSRTYLKGWKDVRNGNPVVGKQEVKCVQRWDAVDEMLLNKFSNR
jgi:hypothetical protein